MLSGFNSAALVARGACADASLVAATECPGCAQSHAAAVANAALPAGVAAATSVVSKLGNAPPPNMPLAAAPPGVAPLNATSPATATTTAAARSVADTLANTASILSALQSARGGVDDEMERLAKLNVDASAQCASAAAGGQSLKRKGSAIKVCKLTAAAKRARNARLQPRTSSSTSTDSTGAYATRQTAGIRAFSRA